MSTLVLLLLCSNFVVITTGQTSPAVTENNAVTTLSQSTVVLLPSPSPAPGFDSLEENAVMFLLASSSTSEWDAMSLGFKSALAEQAYITCNNNRESCNISPSRKRSVILFTPDEVEPLAGYPRNKESDMEIAVVLKLPAGTSPLEYPPVVPQSTFLSIANLASSVITVRIQKTVLQVAIFTSNSTTPLPIVTDSPLPSPSSSLARPPAEEEWHKQAVMIILGLTTRQQWEDDEQLQTVFRETLASEATQYCSSYPAQCGEMGQQQRSGTPQGVVVTASHILQLPGYPREAEGMNLQLAVAIAFPTPINQTTQPRLIPQAAVVAISLRSATPFYLQTGRPLVSVSALSDGSENLLIALGTSIPLLLVLLTAVALLMWAGVTLRARRAKKELEGYSIPEDEVSLLGYRWTAEEEFLDAEELYYTHQ